MHDARRARGIVEHHPRAGLQLLAGMHERVPVRVVHALEQQTLDRAAARVAAPDQPRRKHARVVDDEQVAGAEQLRQIAAIVVSRQVDWRDRRRSAATSPRGRGSCAISDSGSSKSKSETEHAHLPAMRCHMTVASHSAIEDRNEQDQQSQDERDEPHERVVARRRRTAGPRVALEEREVEVVRAPEDVADVAGHRNRADERVDERVDHHADQDDARDVLAERPERAAPP